MDGSVYPITVTVGSSIVGMPTIPTLEGYEFVGGYCGSHKVISSSQQLIDSTFHLYNYGSTANVLNVELKYEVAIRKAKIYVNSKSHIVEVNHGALLQEVIDQGNVILNDNLQSNQMFIGWSFTNKESELIAGSTIATQQVTKDIELYAIIKTKLSITLDYNNGETDSFEIVPGTLTNLPTSGFTKKGYKFVGWCKNKDLSDTPFKQFNYDGKSPLTLYAKWDPEEYTIKYYSSITNGLLTSATYTYGDDNITLANHKDIWTPNGYTFKGWSTSKLENNIITEITADLLGSNITLYAIYTGKIFPVQLIAGSIASLPADKKVQNIEYGKNFSLPIPTIKNEYTSSKEFIGYYYNNIKVTNEKGNSLIKFTETDLNTTYINLNNVMLTAKYENKKFTIKFYSGSESVESQEILYNECVLEPSKNPTLDGYEFICWTKQKDTNDAYDFNSPVTESFDLFAYFTAKTYSVNLEIKAADATIATLDTTSYEITYDQSFTLPVPTTDVAYNFKGYKLTDSVTVTDSNGKSIRGIFNTHNLNCSIDEVEAGLTFTAEFEMKTFKVQYFRNSSLVTTKTINYGDPALDLPIESPTGYEFKGWTANTETKVLYDFTQSSVTNDLDLYAVIEPMQYTLTLQITPLFGTISETSIVVTYDENYKLTVPTMNEGYEFLGYQYQGIDITDIKGDSLKPFTSSSFGIKIGEEIPSTIAVTANCKQIVYTVYYHSNNEINQREVSYGESALNISGPTSLEVGYRFLGWSAQENSKELYDFNTILTDDLHLYAVISNEYKVTLYDSDKTTVLTTFTVEYGSKNWSITCDSSLIPTGEWTGWYLMSDDKMVSEMDGIPFLAYATFNFEEDIELYLN